MLFGWGESPLALVSPVKALRVRVGPLKSLALGNIIGAVQGSILISGTYYSD